MESDQAAHTDFDKLPTKVSLGGEVINLDIFTKAVIFAESFTLQYILYIYNISEMCTHIYSMQWNTVQNNVFTKAVIFSEILDSPLNLSPCIRLWVGGGELDLGWKLE